MSAGSTAAPQPNGERRFRWERVKRLEGSNRDGWLLWQVGERGVGCYFCGDPIDVLDFDVHHFDKRYVPFNARENTAHSHHGCNSATEREASRTAPHPPGEKESPAHAFPADYSAQEGRDHRSMRTNWNDWTRGRRSIKYPLFEDLKRGIRTWYKASDIALKAASACQDPEDEVQHSSKTYRVYLEEDIFEGLYDSKVSKGALMVRISDFFRDILVELGVLPLQTKEPH